jgi:hypothetical protein
VNEADGYHDYVRAMLAATPEGQSARSDLRPGHPPLGLGVVRPGLPMGHWLRSLIA